METHIVNNATTNCQTQKKNKLKGIKMVRKCWKCGKQIPKKVNEYGKQVPNDTIIFYQKCPYCGVLL